MPEAVFFGPTISSAANQLEEAKRFFIANEQRNRDFAFNEQQRLDRLAAQQAELQRADAARRLAQRNFEQQRATQLALRAAQMAQQRQLAGQRIRSAEDIAAARNQSYHDALTRKLAADQAEAAARAETTLASTTGRDNRAFMNRLLRNEEIRDLGEARRTIGNVPLTPAQLEEIGTVIAGRQRRASEEAAADTFRVDQLNKAVQVKLAGAKDKALAFKNFVDQLDPSSLRSAIPDYQSLKFVPNPSIAGSYPQDALRAQRAGRQFFFEPMTPDGREKVVQEFIRAVQDGIPQHVAAKRVFDRYGFDPSEFLP